MDIQQSRHATIITQIIITIAVGGKGLKKAYFQPSIVKNPQIF